MEDQQSDKRRKRWFAFVEIAIIVFLASIPLFISFPYRVNIFLSWEGAYRMSQGQIPYKDFGMPLGYMYWVVPAIFFKLFGVQMISLVKAQVFLNIISGLAFRSIFKNLQIQPGVRLLSVLLYCISFSFFNFWPWYNHTVIVYEMVGLAFLTYYIFNSKNWIWLSLSALFCFFSFFTKQDGGGMTLLLCIVLLTYHCIVDKNWKPLLIYLGSYLLIAFAIIAPLTRYHFGYWFNYGQAPHTSRIAFTEIVDEFLNGSQWIKFYALLIALMAIAYYKKRVQFFFDKKATIFFLLTVGILVEATILQVTSYTPPDNNIFFHSFAFAFIVSFLANYLNLDFNKLKPVLVGCFGLLLWWSGVFWKYFQRITQRTAPIAATKTSSTENIVNRHTYLLGKKDSTETLMGNWVFTGLKTFEKIYMPKPTAEGVQRILNSPLVKTHKLHVLNMSELTPLAAEMPFELDRGSNIPLWYHLGVAMFNREAQVYEERIRKKQYDLVLFEYVPSLNNFYPFRVRDTLLNYYQKVDSFPAPRRGDTQGTIEVFIKPNNLY